LSDEELKLSVSVRVKSRKERNSDSPVPIYGQTHFDTAVLNGVSVCRLLFDPVRLLLY
jgi:hypothetical protein